MGTTPQNVAALRAFNRFHTNVIGALHSGLVNSPFTLTEARVLYELAQAPVTEVRQLRERLDIDAGYLSRILARFATEDLISRRRAEHDGRRQLIELTPSGRRAFASLDRRADRAAADLLTPLSDDEQRTLLAATRTVTGLLGAFDDGAGAVPGEVRIREASEPGDYGWIVQRHGELYAAEYGWGPDFEGLVARIVADHLAEPDRGRVRAWIAERDGRRIGCVSCARRDAGTAQLRVLLVEPESRGQGLGARLVDECLAFARSVGYRRIALLTYDALGDARRIYQRAGFTLTEERPEHAFGHDLVAQVWSRDLSLRT
jgi:DNA-binding MarR family transcriptional regulator/GNAT superfamily N-acetyltransferase